MKVFVCKDFKGVYLPGTLVVVARDKARARILVKRKLARDHKLEFKTSKGKPAKLIEVDLDFECCLVLRDGDY